MGPRLRPSRAEKNGWSGKRHVCFGIDSAAPRIATRLFPSSASASTLGAVKIAGTIRASAGIGWPRRRDLGSHALVYLIAGKGRYEDGTGRRHDLRPGNLLWLFPGLPHSYGPESGGRWDEIYLVFDGPLVDLWRGQKVIDPERPVWKLEPVAFWFRRILEVATAAEEGSTGWEDAFRQMSLLQNLVADMLLACRDKEDVGDDRRWLARACRELGAAGGGAADLPGIARRCGLSYENFRKKFTRRMGVAPAAYRRARTVERACALLMERSHSHKEIAEELGFCDEFHFSKTFRKVTGLSPHAFRMKALGPSPH